MIDTFLYNVHENLQKKTTALNTQMIENEFNIKFYF